MTNKRNLATVVLVVLIAIFAIVSFSTGLFGESKITSPLGSNTSTPTIVAPQPLSPLEGELAIDCPGCPIG